MSLLGVSLAFHTVGLTIWIGAAFLLPIAILPAIRSLEAAQQIKFMDVFSRYFIPWFIVGGVAVGITGWVQTFQLLDVLKFNVILTKHYVILPLIAISGYIWFFLARKMSKPGADNSKWWRQLIVLAWAQAILGVVVLVLAAILVS
jgi:uncharacterized membrane protein